MTATRWACGESDNPERRSTLLSAARRIATYAARDPAVVAVLLTGSVARRPVMEASDLDLHLILTRVSEVLPTWSFSENFVLNVHHVLAADLKEASECLHDPEAAVEWLHRTLLGDEMHGFQLLYRSPAFRGIEQVSRIVHARQEPRISAPLAERFVRDCREFLEAAEQALAAGAIADAHQHLRWGIQRLLIGRLVERGWMIRGSKHQVEIAAAFLPDRAIERVLDTLLEVVDADVTRAEAEKIAGARLRSRWDLLDALRRWKQWHPEELDSNVEFQLRHNTGAFDYYAPAMHAGLFRGAVNHIRAISGFSRIPSWLLPLFEIHSAWPISALIKSQRVPPPLRDSWLGVMALSVSASKVQSLLRKMQLLARGT